jgi:hypothetical protein
MPFDRRHRNIDKLHLETHYQSHRVEIITIEQQKKKVISIVASFSVKNLSETLHRAFFTIALDSNKITKESQTYSTKK